jgi:hypothetical protein
LDAGSADSSRCRITFPRLGRSRLATLATAWIIALSPLLAHPRQQQAEGLRGHGPLLGQIIPERERVEQARRGCTQRQYARFAATIGQQLDQRFRISLGVDHRDRHPAQRQLQNNQQRQRRLAPAGLTGDGDGSGPVQRRG